MDKNIAQRTLDEKKLSLEEVALDIMAEAIDKKKRVDPQTFKAACALLSYIEKDLKTRLTETMLQYRLDGLSLGRSPYHGVGALKKHEPTDGETETDDLDKHELPKDQE